MNIAIIILLIILLIIGLMNLAVLLAARKRKNVGEPFRMNDDNNSEWFIKFNESKDVYKRQLFFLEKSYNL